MRKAPGFCTLRLFCVMDNVLQLSSTVSTNLDAYKLAQEGAVHGFSVMCQKQSGGKGRLGKHWVSTPNKSLCCSIILRPQLPFAEFPKLTLSSGLALCKAVESVTGLRFFGLKWPNDLYYDDRKCAGILVESSNMTENYKDFFVIVGIGVNVNNVITDFPHSLQSKVTSLKMLTQKNYSIDRLFCRVRDALLQYVRVHEELGFSAIAAEWKGRDALFGKKMLWLRDDREIIEGVGKGIDTDGQLLLEENNGTIRRILSGDVSLKK